MFKKVIKVLGLIVLLVSSLGIYTNAETSSVKILFTTELLDSIEPIKYSEDDVVSSFGGYAKIKNIVLANKDSNTLLVDTGNFSYGSIYSSLNDTKAPSLDLMKDIGYEAILLAGNELTDGEDGLSKMLSVLEGNPPLLKGNLNYEDNGSRSVKDYYIYTKAGKKILVFGVVDTDSLNESNKPYFASEEETVTKILNDASTEGADIVVCLYNGEADSAKEIANNHNEIDVIITSKMSGTNEMKVGNTVIVSAQNKGKEVGYLEIKDDGSYTLSNIPVSSNIVDNNDISTKINSFQKDIQTTILNRYGLSYQTVFARSKFDLDAPNKEKENFAIVDFITDAYRNSYTFREDDEVKTVIAITNGESIKGGLYKGDISINDVVSLVSSEKGDDDLAGLSLVRVYLSGSDLRTICELDASSLKDDENQRLFFGGMKYDYNENRSLWNRVEEVYVSATVDYYIPIKNDEIYPVVMNTKMYTLLGELIENCEEDISWSPIGIRDEINPEIRTILLRNNDGTLVKEWSSIASYIRKGDKDTSGKFIIDEKYSGPIQKKNNDDTLNPLKLLKNIKKEALVDFAKKIGLVIGAIVILQIIIYIINRYGKKETTDI